MIALAAAMQDSSLHNLAFGEADAVGLFQQRPSLGWGDEGVLLEPRLAAWRSSAAQAAVSSRRRPVCSTSAAGSS